MPKTLTWDDAGKIGVLLSNKHPEVYPLEIGLRELHQYVKDLSEFSGDPTAFEEKQLEAIRAAWNTEFLERTQA